jgi:NADH dehydrogenase
VHIFNLIGFRNRLLLMIDWAWAYIFYEHGVRLIVPGFPSSESAHHSGESW